MNTVAGSTGPQQKPYLWLLLDNCELQVDELEDNDAVECTFKLFIGLLNLTITLRIVSQQEAKSIPQCRTGGLPLKG